MKRMTDEKQAWFFYDWNFALITKNVKKFWFGEIEF
jgi:hypothetical protein